MQKIPTATPETFGIPPDQYTADHSVTFCTRIDTRVTVSGFELNSRPKTPDSRLSLTTCQLAPEFFPVLEAVEPRKVFRIRLAGLDLEGDEDGPLFLENVRQLALPLRQIGDLEGFFVAGGLGKIGETNLPGARRRHRTVGFVAAVLAQAVNVILRRLIGDGHQAAEVHQQAAVAVEHDN